MAIVKVVGVIAGSEKSFDDATQKALQEASKSVSNIRSIYIKEMNANGENNKIVSYGVNAKISYEEDSQ
ncbi:hypothetical protein BH24BAC1_BH24BAC1_26560 [soil metagenome]